MLATIGTGAWCLLITDLVRTLVMMILISKSISGENRVRAVERLAQHAEIVIVHDTQQPSYGWPQDWELSKKSENPVWGGRWWFTSN